MAHVKVKEEEGQPWPLRQQGEATGFAPQQSRQQQQQWQRQPQQEEENRMDMGVLSFRDFVPVARETARKFVDERGAYRRGYKRESFLSLMERVNSFVGDPTKRIRVINVETLQLPAAEAATLTQYKPQPASSTASNNTIVQCVRVWYIASPEQDPGLPEQYGAQYDSVQGRATAPVEEL